MKRKPPSSRERLIEPRAVVALQWRKPCGSYEVDAFAKVMFPKADPKNAVPVMAAEATRREINRAAQIAVFHEHHERHELRKARDLARRLDKLLKTLDQETAGLFPEGDSAVIAADIAQGFLKPTSVVAPLVEIIDSLRASADMLRRFQIKPSPPSRSDPLARAFLEALGKAYKYWIKTQPPRSRQSAFVKLAAAAWLDLDFPLPRPDTSLEHWLGTKVERLYRV